MKKRIVCFMLAITFMFLFPIQMTAANNAVMEARRSVVRLYTVATDGSKYIGSAFAVGKAGQPVQYFITCDHCVSGKLGGLPMAQIYVVLDTLSDSVTRCPASVVYCTNQLQDGPDFAIIKTQQPISQRVPITLKTKEYVHVSDSAYAIGFPSSADNDIDNIPSKIDDMTVTNGIVSKLSLAENIKGAPKKWTTNYQTDAAINGGNSGGPLVDDRGNAIGISAFGIASESINGAVWIDKAIPVLKQNNIPYMLYTPTPSGFSLLDFLSKNIVVVIIIGVAVVALIIALIIILALKKGRSKPRSNTTPARLNPETPATERAKKPVLLSTGALYPGQEISISEGPLIIGRDPKRCNLVVNQETPGISSAHCQISYSGGNFIIKDLGSTYGTFLSSGAKLSPNQEQIIGVNAAFYLAEKQNSFITKLL